MAEPGSHAESGAAASHAVHADAHGCHGAACEDSGHTQVETASCAVAAGHCFSAFLRDDGFARLEQMATGIATSPQGDAAPSGLTPETETPPPRA